MLMQPYVLRDVPPIRGTFEVLWRQNTLLDNLRVEANVGYQYQRTLNEREDSILVQDVEDHQVYHHTPIVQGMYKLTRTMIIGNHQVMEKADARHPNIVKRTRYWIEKGKGDVVHLYKVKSRWITYVKVKGLHMLACIR